MTNVDDVFGALEDHITETYSLRSGGTLACGEDALYVVRDGEDTVRITLDNILEVRYDEFDWFLGIVSLTLVGFGLYSTSRDVLLGLVFAAVGAGSFYLTYRKRGKITFQVSERPKPLEIYPKSGETVYEALHPLIKDK